MTFNLQNDKSAILITGADTAVFNAIYKAYWKELCLFAYKITGSSEVAKDMVQEVFIDLLERHEGRKVENISAYLKQSVRFQCLNWIRNNKIWSEHLNRMKIVMETNDVEETINEIFINESIRAILPRMPDRCRKVFEMSRSEYLTNQEIADKLDISIRTVENHLTRALRIIRLHFKHS